MNPLQIHVVIDSRERDLWDAIHTKEQPSGSLLRQAASISDASPVHEMLPFVERSMLKIGDVWIVRRDPATGKEMILMIWERKTVSDLWSSVRDGRYHEQHDRVAAFSADLPYRMTYLRMIEGPCPNPTTNGLHTIPHDTFFHICLKTYPMTESFMVQTVRTCTIRETVLLLHAVWKKACAPTGMTPEMRSEQESLFRSLSHSKKTGAKRQDNIQPRFVLASALAQIPRLSFATAEKIASVFTDIACFVREYNNDETEWRKKIMMAIGKSSPKLIDKIIHLFFSHENDLTES